MDVSVAIQLGLAINQAYEIQPCELCDRAGEKCNVGTTQFLVIASIYACDLATDINPQRGNNRVSIGLILQDGPGNVVIAMRGTEGVWEWIHDAEFAMVPCPIQGGSGHTDDGFTAMYKSLNVLTPSGTVTLIQAIKNGDLKFPREVISMTICGHSLGAALVTLLALDVAINTVYQSPVVYTFASPRTGGPNFADAYNNVLPNTVRIANRMDLVPKLPLPPLYKHVTAPYELNTIKLGIPPVALVKPSIPCEHYLNTYLFLLSQQCGGDLQLEAQCKPAAGLSFAEVVQAV